MNRLERRVKKLLDEYEKKGLRKSPRGFGKYNRKRKTVIRIH